MTHPLTDEKTEELIAPEVIENPEDYAYYLAGIPVSDAIRLAKDWQLEQVIEWLKDHLDERYIDDGDVLAPGIDAESVVDDFRAAMRPQEDN